MTDKEYRMFFDAEIVFYDRDGDVVTTTEVEHAGAFKLEDMREQVLFNDVVDIEIVPQGFTVEDQYGATVNKVTTDE